MAVLLKPWLIECSTSISRALRPESIPEAQICLLLNHVGLVMAKSRAAIRSDRGAFFTMKALAPALFAART